MVVDSGVFSRQVHKVHVGDAVRITTRDPGGGGKEDGYGTPDLQRKTR